MGTFRDVASTVGLQFTAAMSTQKADQIHTIFAALHESACGTKRTLQPCYAQHRVVAPNRWGAIPTSLVEKASRSYRVVRAIPDASALSNAYKAASAWTLVFLKTIIKCDGSLARVS